MIKSVVKIESIPIPDQEFIVPLIKSIPIYCRKKNLVVVDFASCAPVNIFFWTLSVENKIRERTANEPVDAFGLMKKISRILRWDLFFSLKPTNESKESEWLFLYGERGPKTFDGSVFCFYSLSTFSNEHNVERKESFGYVITARLLAAHLCYPEATVTKFGSRLRYFHWS